MKEWVKETKKELDFAREASNVTDVAKGLLHFAPSLNVEVPMVIPTIPPLAKGAMVLAYFPGPKVLYLYLDMRTAFSPLPSSPLLFAFYKPMNTR
jgi:hypothetical protein